MEKILVVDDDVLVLRAISKLLSIKGFSVKEARNGEEAIRFLHNESFDLIISDIRMAGIDGIQVVERLRAMGKDTPVILVTGYASENAPVEAYRLGVSGYVLKPFDAADLLAKVSKSLSKSKGIVGNSRDFFLELKQIIKQFEDENGPQIFENKKLKVFIDKISEVVFFEEKYRIKTDE